MMTGWEDDAYGYHGDDGAKFHAFGRGTEFGPKFTTGDVIGCGINFFDGTAFYTKNGIHLGIAFRDVMGEFYPMIGLRSFLETVEANFGQDKFVFDIDKYAKELFKEANKQTDISSPIPNTP
ncbi:11172_t:CDS:2 [Paraglomus brasilianum]|uniref:11172_t:CDS:1 n=1 Tax=Paraglomus brasilianum TaxID=144538 RepID=A0A9N9B7W3_9GLOM|nr:11172_t:CDS:2 [Paraglomus brasilianum]